MTPEMTPIIISLLTLASLFNANGTEASQVKPKQEFLPAERNNMKAEEKDDLSWMNAKSKKTLDRLLKDRQQGRS